MRFSLLCITSSTFGRLDEGEDLTSLAFLKSPLWSDAPYFWGASRRSDAILDIRPLQNLFRTVEIRYNGKQVQATLLSFIIMAIVAMPLKKGIDLVSVLQGSLILRNLIWSGYFGFCASAYVFSKGCKERKL